MTTQTQQLINLGTAANDGTGESLRDAFAAVNNNFANVWAQGPVNTNVIISNNRVTTTVTNLDLELAGNGMANIRVASSTRPTIDDMYDLGSPQFRFSEVHAQYFYGTASFLTGNLSAAGNIQGNYILGNGYFLTGINSGGGNIDLTHVQTNIIPDGGSLYIGNVSNQWNSLWVSSTINLNSVPLSVTGTTLKVNGVSVVTVNSNPTFANVTVSGNITPNAIYTDNWFYANGAPFPQGSNSIPGTTISLKDNAISTTVTNQNLVIEANGIGIIQSNSTVLPGIDGVYDLGSANRRWGEVHAQYYYGNGAFLTGIAGGANVNSFSVISANGTTITAEVPGDTLTLTPGQNITVTGNSTSDTVTFGLANSVSISGNLAAVGNAVFGNVSSTGTVQAGGNVQANSLLAVNLSLSGNVVGNLAVLGNARATNITALNDITAVRANVIGPVSAQGNVISQQFVIGNGRFLTGVVASGGFAVPGADGDILFAESSTASALPGLNFNQTSNVLSVQGNVTAQTFSGSGTGLTETFVDLGGDSPNWNSLMRMGAYTVNRLNWGGTTGTPLDSTVYVGLLSVKSTMVGNTVVSVEQSFYPGTFDINNITVEWSRSYWSGAWTAWVRMTNDGQNIDGGAY